MPARAYLFVGIALIYVGVLIALDFLRFPLRADEQHFWPTTLWFFHDGLPTLSELRSYDELSTPLPFLLFGAIAHFTGSGIVVARVVDFVLSAGFVLLIGAVGRFSLWSGLCALGLIACPYFLAVSTHYYTDMITVAFVGIGLAFHLAKRPFWSGFWFILAIACRQYAVAFPVAILMSNISDAVVTRSARVNSCQVAMMIAIISLGAWYAFFGGPVPQGALASQAVSEVARWYPAHGLYFLACVGLYFVVVEIVIFRSLSGIARPTWIQLLIAVAMVALFYAFPPSHNVNGGFATMGYMDKAARFLLGDGERIALFCALALLSCLRFTPLSLAGTMLYSNAALMIAAPVAWDKYALPLLACFWLLKSAGRLDESWPSDAAEGTDIACARTMSL
jgi:hypothetical protein